MEWTGPTCSKFGAIHRAIHRGYPQVSGRRAVRATKINAVFIMLYETGTFLGPGQWHRTVFATNLS